MTPNRRQLCRTDRRIAPLTSTRSAGVNRTLLAMCTRSVAPKVCSACPRLVSECPSPVGGCRVKPIDPDIQRSTNGGKLSHSHPHLSSAPRSAQLQMRAERLSYQWNRGPIKHGASTRMVQRYGSGDGSMTDHLLSIENGSRREHHPILEGCLEICLHFTHISKSHR